MEIYHPDIKGIIKGIAEEYSFHNNSLNDASNWGEAEHIFNTHVYPYLVYGNSDYQEKRVKFIHELIAARARRISEVSPERNAVTNWLAAQKQYAVGIYNGDYIM